MLQTALHFTLLVYPFRHGVLGKNRRTQLQQLSNRWTPWWSRLLNEKDNNKGLRRALDDTYFFVPYICKLLFPETDCLRHGNISQGIEQEVEKARQLAHLSVDQLTEKLRQHGVLRLTYDPSKLSDLNDLQLEFGEEFCALVKLSWIDVALCPQNIGFLILKVGLNETNPTIEKLNDFLYHLRHVHPPRIDWQLANWKYMRSGNTLTFSNRELVDFLLQGLAGNSTYQHPTLDAYLRSEHRDGHPTYYSTTEEGQVFGQTYRQYTYACLAAPSDVQLSRTSGISNQTLLSSSETNHPIFDSPVQQIVYELATCTQTSQPDYRPHPEGLKQIMEKGHIALWANWEGMALHDNVVFLGTSPTPFTCGDLAHNVENDYFSLYLLTLYQKMRLSIFSGELMRHSDDLYDNLKEARSLMDNFVRFRNHYWFANVTFKPQGTTIYQHFQHGLDVKSLYESVSNEVQELQEYYESKAQRRVNTLLNFLTFVGLPAGILSQLYGGVLVKQDGGPLIYNREAWIQFGVVTLCVYALSGFIYLLWKRYWR